MRALHDHEIKFLDTAAAAPTCGSGEVWAVEIKRGERLRLADWWQQSCAQTTDCYRWPALAYRPNRQPRQVIVPLDIIMWGYPHWENTAAADYTATLGIAGFAAVIRETRST